jgi:hypothetical protein
MMTRLAVGADEDLGPQPFSKLALEQGERPRGSKLVIIVVGMNVEQFHKASATARQN